MSELLEPASSARPPANQTTEPPLGRDPLSLLDQLLVEPERSLPKPPIAKINYSHDGMIDLIIANPGISQNQIAATFGYTAAWVSRVACSDAFQARLAERRRELIDPAIIETAESRIKALFMRSMEILEEKLEGPSNTIPDNLALRTAELAARAAGYGARDIVVQTSPKEVHNHLHVMAGNLTALLREKRAEAQESLTLESHDDQKAL